MQPAQCLIILNGVHPGLNNGRYLVIRYKARISFFFTFQKNVEERQTSQRSVM